MSSLLQNIKRNIRTRRGPTSHSPSRSKEKEKDKDKGDKEKEKGSQNDSKGFFHKDKGRSYEKIHLESVSQQSKQSKDGTQTKQLWDKSVPPKVETTLSHKAINNNVLEYNTTSRSGNVYNDGNVASKQRQSVENTTSVKSNCPAAGPPDTSGEDTGQSRSQKVSLTLPEQGQSRFDSRPPRSRSAFTGLTNGGHFEDSGVDLDSSQGGTSLTSDLLSPLHSRDNSSHSSHVGNHVGSSHPGSGHIGSNSHVANPRSSAFHQGTHSAFVQQGKLLQTAMSKLSPDYISMNGLGDITDESSVSDGRVPPQHVREVSQSSSRSTNSSGSDNSKSSSNKSGKHTSPSAMSQPRSNTSQEEVYVKMNDFDRERSLSPPNRQEPPRHQERGIQNKPKVEDHEYVNLLELAKVAKDSQLRNQLNQLNARPLRTKPPLPTHKPDPTSINEAKKKEYSMTNSNPNSKDNNSHIPPQQQIEVQVHTQPNPSHTSHLSQVNSNLNTHNLQTNLQNNISLQNSLQNNQRLNDRPLKYRKPISEESDIDSTSESVTSQEVAVLTAISRRRRGQHLFHKHVAARKAGKEEADNTEKFNTSLVSFAEQSILSFLSNMDANSDSESETNPATQCEHATRNFLKTSPTPTNMSSDTGGSPVRIDTATPTNENQSHVHPNLHQIVAVYDLVSLTLSKTGYNYPHYGIHVHLQKFQDHLSPTSERAVSTVSVAAVRSVSSSNSSSLKLSKTGSSIYTPPGGFADDYMLPAVMAIDQDGVAGHDGRIRTGDYIIEVNGTNVLDKTAEDTEALINSDDMLHLVTTRGRSAIR